MPFKNMRYYTWRVFFIVVSPLRPNPHLQIERQSYPQFHHQDNIVFNK